VKGSPSRESALSSGWLMRTVKCLPASTVWAPGAASVSMLARGLTVRTLGAQAAAPAAITVALTVSIAPVHRMTPIAIRR
jgi:hypothetical protein